MKLNMTFSPITHHNPLILASESPRRKELLDQMKLPYISQPSNVDENHIDGTPVSITRCLAEKKAMAVFSRERSGWILGADTVVVLGDSILGKPESLHDARSMLTVLSGKEHQVVTGFCLVNPAGIIAHREGVITAVRMKQVTTREINAYIATAEPFGKAGSYAIQGVGAFLVESISGSYSNVVGLPLCALIKALIRVGAIDQFP